MTARYAGSIHPRESGPGGAVARGDFGSASCAEGAVLHGSKVEGVGASVGTTLDRRAVGAVEGKSCGCAGC